MRAVYRSPGLAPGGASRRWSTRRARWAWPWRRARPVRAALADCCKRRCAAPIDAPQAPADRGRAPKAPGCTVRPRRRAPAAARSRGAATRRSCCHHRHQRQDHRHLADRPAGERAGSSACGNIGPTCSTRCAHLDAGTLPEVWVLELSSFQLDGVQGFEPTAATVLNITQDHLDWHGDMAAYARGQGPHLRHARPDGAQPRRRRRDGDAARAGARQAAAPPACAHCTFGAGLPRRPGDYGIERINGMAWLVRALEADETHKRKRGARRPTKRSIMQRLMPADALRIRGRHNALNALAALALASAAAARWRRCCTACANTAASRIASSRSRIVDEVEYFDDSKGTNVGATVAALCGPGRRAPRRRRSWAAKARARTSRRWPSRCAASRARWC